jgi:hypothetical protein
MVSPPKIGLDAARFQQIGNCLAGEPGAFGVKGRGAAIDVIVAGAAGGKFELAQAETDAGKNREQLLRVG